MTRIDAVVMAVGIDGAGEPKRIDSIVMFAGIDADGLPRPLLVDSSGAPIQAVAASIAHGTVTVDTAVGGTLIVAARADRKRVFIQGPVAATVYVGNTGLATSNGYPIVGDGTNSPSLVLETTAAIYGIVASGSEDVRYLEEYGA